jgi:hypothetical protein
MELLSALRQLLQRRRVLLLGALLCGALGVAASGYVPVGPFASPERRSAVSTAEIQIDTPHPLAADLRASTATIAEQAAMLGERLAGDDTRGLIAARAGVRSRDLAVLSSRTAIIGRSNPLARAAVEASGSVQTPVRLIVSSASDTPIVSVLAAAPDRATATRLAAAAAPALRFVIASAPDTVRKRLEVQALSSPKTVTVVSGGPRPAIGVILALFGFIGWCWCAILASGLARIWREGVATDPFAPGV